MFSERLAELCQSGMSLSLLICFFLTRNTPWTAHPSTRPRTRRPMIFWTELSVRSTAPRFRPAPPLSYSKSRSPRCLRGAILLHVLPRS